MKNHTLASLGMLVVVLMALALAAPASADREGNILRVGPGQNYETIQDAVNAARQGSRILVYSRIQVAPDYYEESVEITTNNLQIIAQGSDLTVIRPPKERTPGFKVNADHVTIRGFEISGAVDAPGIVFQGSHNTFAENTIGFPLSHFQGVPAIECDDDDGGSDYNTIESNEMSKWGGTGPGLSDSDLERHMSHGISIRSFDGLNEGNVIKNNMINEVHQAGINVVNGTGFQIFGNSIEKTNQGSGISIRADNNAYQGHHRILQNTIIGCAKSGIFLYASNGTVLAHNHISDNEISQLMEGCITLSADSGAALVYNHVISNYIGDGADYGVNLSADQDAAVNNNLIRDNVIYRTYVAGISLTTGSDHNRIMRNEVQIYYEFGVAIAGDNNLILGNWIWNGRWTYEDTGVGNRWRNNSYVAP